ncbi:MAG: RNA-binding S4 domain-containing protein [Burkholderiaceae bacterium]
MDEPVRLDKWLWAARIYKTRSLASDEIALGRVSVNDAPAKASREVRLGDLITVRRAGLATVIRVLGLSSRRGPAAVAQRLYEETPDSRAERERRELARRLAPEPAAALAQGRPTKRDRRTLADWQRWSASTDE